MAGVLDAAMSLLNNAGNVNVPSMPVTPTSAPDNSGGGNWAQQYLNAIGNNGGGLTTLGGGTASSTAAQQQASEPLWKKALGVLDVPRSLVANLISDEMSGHFGQGWGNAVSLNPANHISTSDLLNQAGWQANSQSPLWDRMLHGAAGFAGDVLLDPTTYLSFGASAAGKVGLEAAGKAAEDFATRFGVDAAKGAGKDLNKLAEGTAQNVVGAYKAKYAPLVESGQLDPNLYAQKAQELHDMAVNHIMQAASTAQQMAKKSAVNFDIPFTNVAKSLAKKPGFLQPTFDAGKYGEIGGQKVRQILTDAGIINPTEQNRIVADSLGHLGITTPEQMTPDMVRGLTNTIENTGKTVPQDVIDQTGEVLNPARTVTTQTPTDVLGSPVANALRNPTGAGTPANQRLAQLFQLAKERGVPAGREEEYVRSLLGELSDKHGVGFDELLKQLDQQVAERTAHNAQVYKNVKGASQFGARPVEQLPNVIRPGNRMLDGGFRQTTQELPAEFGASNVMNEAVKSPDVLANDIIQGMKNYVPDANEMSSPLGRLVGNALKPLNARGGLGTATTWDALNRMRSQRFDLAHRVLPQLEKQMSELTPVEKSLIPHLVEREMPTHLTAAEKEALNGKNAGLMEQVANTMRQMGETFAQNEQAAGVLDKTLPNYFYHMLSGKGMSKEDLAAAMEDPIFRKYAGRSMTNKSNLERGSFKTLAQWRNAMHDLQESLQTAPEEDKAAIQDKLSQMQNLYETDPMKAMVARYQRSIRATNYGNMFKQLEQDGLVRKPGSEPLSPEASKGFVKLTGDEKKIADLTGLKQGTLVHKDVLNALQKVDKAFQPENFGNVLNNLDGILNIWKAMPIIYNPAHYKTRAVGDAMNAMLGGAKVQDFKDAVDLWKAAKDGTLSPEQEKMWKTAIDNGVVSAHSGQLGDIQNEMINKSDRVRNLENMVYNNRVGKVMGGGLNWMDNQSRLALFLRGMKTYNNPKQAAQLVRKYLFNYSELTKADQSIRFAVPFWTWTKNNIPLMLQEFARQPRYFSAYVKLQNTLNQNHQPTFPYADDYLHLGGQWFFNPRAPLQDLSTLDTPRATVLGNMINPFMTYVPETYGNENYFTQMPIDQLRPQGTPASAKSSLQFLAGQLLAGGPSNAAKIATEKNKPLWDRIANGLVGGVSQQNPSSIIKEQRWQQKEARTLARSAAKRAARQASQGG